MANSSSSCIDLTLDSDDEDPKHLPPPNNMNHRNQATPPPAAPFESVRPQTKRQQQHRDGEKNSNNRKTVAKRRNPSRKRKKKDQHAPEAKATNDQGNYKTRSKNNHRRESNLNHQNGHNHANDKEERAAPVEEENDPHEFVIGAELTADVVDLEDDDDDNNENDDNGGFLLRFSNIADAFFQRPSSSAAPKKKNKAKEPQQDPAPPPEARQQRESEEELAGGKQAPRGAPNKKVLPPVQQEQEEPLQRTAATRQSIQEPQQEEGRPRRRPSEDKQPQHGSSATWRKRSRSNSATSTRISSEEPPQEGNRPRRRPSEDKQSQHGSSATWRKRPRSDSATSARDSSEEPRTNKQFMSFHSSKTTPPEQLVHHRGGTGSSTTNSSQPRAEFFSNNKFTRRTNVAARKNSKDNIERRDAAGTLHKIDKANNSTTAGVHGRTTMERNVLRNRNHNNKLVVEVIDIDDDDESSENDQQGETKQEAPLGKPPNRAEICARKHPFPSTKGAVIADSQKSSERQQQQKNFSGKSTSAGKEASLQPNIPKAPQRQPSCSTASSSQPPPSNVMATQQRQNTQEEPKSLGRRAGSGDHALAKNVRDETNENSLIRNRNYEFQNNEKPATARLEPSKLAGVGKTQQPQARPPNTPEEVEVIEVDDGDDVDEEVATGPPNRTIQDEIQNIGRQRHASDDSLTKDVNNEGKDELWKDLTKEINGTTPSTEKRKDKESAKRDQAKAEQKEEEDHFADFAIGAELDVDFEKDDTAGMNATNVSEDQFNAMADSFFQRRSYETSTTTSSTEKPKDKEDSAKQEQAEDEQKEEEDPFADFVIGAELDVVDFVEKKDSAGANAAKVSEDRFNAMADSFFQRHSHGRPNKKRKPAPKPVPEPEQPAENDEVEESESFDESDNYYTNGADSLNLTMQMGAAMLEISGNDSDHDLYTQQERPLPHVPKPRFKVVVMDVADDSSADESHKAARKPRSASMEKVEKETRGVSGVSETMSRNVHTLFESKKQIPPKPTIAPIKRARFRPRESAARKVKKKEKPAPSNDCNFIMLDNVDDFDEEDRSSFQFRPTAHTKSTSHNRGKPLPRKPSVYEIENQRRYIGGGGGGGGGGRKNYKGKFNGAPKLQKHEYSWKFTQVAAEELQDRLLKEAASRVREQGWTNSYVCVTDEVADTKTPQVLEPTVDIEVQYPSHWNWKDPYARLGLPRKAPLHLVKKHYRRLARLYHPDKSVDPQASAKFNGVASAYRHISNIE